MKKIGVFAILVFVGMILVLAADNESVSGNSTNTTSNNSSNITNVSLSKIDKGFQCLEEKANNCTGLSVEEIALTILASPKGSYDSCLEKLKSKESNNNWGDIKDTALAILALKHSGENTDNEEEWLLSKSLNPGDITWFLQEDSEGLTECSISYGSNSYTISIGEDKKINKDAGSCLTRAQSNFWLRIDPDCYDDEFITSCDQDFITSLLYKNQDSDTIYVLEGTISASSFSSTLTKVSSKCFGSVSCDYEASAWAAVALLETGHDIEEYVPYIIARADSNDRFLPESFIYILTGYDDYATKLIANQKLGNYWEAENTAYDKFYDTSLALLAIGDSSQEQVVKAKERLLFAQDKNGCWQNSVRDTAIILWALEGRPGRNFPDVNGNVPDVTYCSEANFFCLSKSDCDTADLRENFFCSGAGKFCCSEKNLKSCSEYGGVSCKSGEYCDGNEKEATDNKNCCTGTCKERLPDDINECVNEGYSCSDECGDGETEADLSCGLDSEEVCCKEKGDKPEPDPENGIPTYVWVLIVLIVIILVAILWIYRENLKLLWFKMKSGFKKDKGKSDGSPFSRPGGLPPRPGFPPVRRQPAPVAHQNPRPGPQQVRAPQKPQPPVQKRDEQMSDTFKKLRDMAS